MMSTAVVVPKAVATNWQKYGDGSRIRRRERKHPPPHAPWSDDEGA